MTIELYQMKCEANKIDKTGFITSVATINGTFRASVNVYNPVITFTSPNLLSFNYVFIESLHRYYFVSSVTILSKEAYEITLREDCLYSFKNRILAQTGIVLRNENDYNPKLVDPLFVSNIDYIETAFPISDHMEFYDYNREHSIVFMGVK